MVTGSRYGNNNSVLTWGATYQYAGLGDIKQHLGNVGVMYGMPISQRFAIIGDCLGTYILSSKYKSIKIDINDPYMLNLGIYVDYYISSTFKINAGLKKVLLVDDYKSTEFVIGSGTRF